MEAIGQVNKYTCKSCTWEFNTINLNTGVTPFTCKCISCGSHDCYSNLYRIKHTGPMTILYVWYRPRKEDLNIDVQDHVLNGGLIFGKLGQVNPILDEVTVDCTLIEFKVFTQVAYGKV